MTLAQPGRDVAPQLRDDLLRDDLQQLVRLAIREDLGRGIDLTTVAVVPPGLEAAARIVPRVSGVAAGLELVSCSGISAVRHVYRIRLSARWATKLGTPSDLSTIRAWVPASSMMIRQKASCRRQQERLMRCAGETIIKRMTRWTTRPAVGLQGSFTAVLLRGVRRHAASLPAPDDTGIAGLR